MLLLHCLDEPVDLFAQRNAMDKVNAEIDAIIKRSRLQQKAA